MRKGVCTRKWEKVSRNGVEMVAFGVEGWYNVGNKRQTDRGKN